MASDLAELTAAAMAATPKHLPDARAALQSHMRLVEAWIKVCAVVSFFPDHEHDCTECMYDFSMVGCYGSTSWHLS